MTPPATSRRCLLIAPLSFYSFHRTLAAGLERRGYAVDLLNEEYPANSFGKVLGKLALPVLRRLTLRGLQARLGAQAPYDLVLIIKGRGLGPAALAYLRTRARRIVGYNFDSFGFNPSPLDWHHLTDRYASFDIHDAAERGLPLVHLFSAVARPVTDDRCFDLSIIQRVHSDRLAYTDRVLRALPAGQRPFVFLYESSPLTFLLGLLRHPRLYARLWPHISFKPLPYAQAMDALARSRVSFDYAHPKQSGITVRCFEAQSLGVAVLTSNLAAVDSGLFEPGSIAHLPKDAPAEALGKLLAELAGRAPRPRRRSLDDFLDDLLDEREAQTARLSNNAGD
ncbi:MAG: hypothetical protein JNJ60_00635 [Rhodocyclaceae bacterium]|nr:hypothetical protein [Rhodocyclaceae bacterium]